MLDRPKQESAILYDGTLFRVNDIVTIKTSGTYGHELTGRISWIDTLEFMLDMSEKHNSCERKFKYNDLSGIRYAAKEGEN